MIYYTIAYHPTKILINGLSPGSAVELGIWGTPPANMHAAPLKVCVARPLRNQLHFFALASPAFGCSAIAGLFVRHGKTLEHKQNCKLA